MSKILISSSLPYNSQANTYLKDSLSKAGHYILRPELYFGENVNKAFNLLKNETDVWIFLLTKGANARNIEHEWDAFLNAVKTGSRGTLLILAYDVTVDTIENGNLLQDTNAIYTPDYFSQANMDALLEKIINGIDVFSEARKAANENAQAIKAEVSSTSKTFIDGATTELNAREDNLKIASYLCLTLGFLGLIGAIIATMLFASDTVNHFNVATKIGSKIVTETKPNWSLTIFYTVKNLVIISLFAAVSRYCLLLGKSFMVESLKVAERAHAIGFGKLYMAVYDYKVDAAELKEVFSNWNISGQKNAFDTVANEDVSPKMIDKGLDILGKAAEVIKASKN